ncbi:MAG: iron-sulfur cluster assembly scaffold protein [Stenotrophobium sp.]
MTAENVFGYSTAIWQRFSEPVHGGSLAGADVVSAEAGSAAARALLRVQVRLDASTVEEARFGAYGCPTTLAVGEWLASRLQGQMVAGLGAISAAEIRAALEIPDDRAHCALMGEDVVRRLLTQVAP